jgi:hypothetical protein
MVDMKNAANVVPGVFEAKGHDYRADLAPFVRWAFDLKATAKQLDRITEAMRRYELARTDWIKEMDKKPDKQTVSDGAAPAADDSGSGAGVGSVAGSPPPNFVETITGAGLKEASAPRPARKRTSGSAKPRTAKPPTAKPRAAKRAAKASTAKAKTPKAPAKRARKKPTAPPPDAGA